jgi:ribosomal protein L1
LKSIIKSFRIRNFFYLIWNIKKKMSFETAQLIQNLEALINKLRTHKKNNEGKVRIAEFLFDHQAVYYAISWIIKRLS